MRMLDLIEKKRDKQKLSKEEIEFIIKNYTNGQIPDYQMSAFLMAVYFNGMDNEESTNLALEMMHSGDVYDLSNIKGIKIDKHSTGGVGDKVTLVLGPLMAACGATFAKMSGRGLGHTGGTLDKLESIPDFNIELSEKEFTNQVNKIGLAVIGQTDNITPADKKIYSLRDVTATVPSIPLIASSIMSKKLASGADAVCLDVKVGSGAFMNSVEEATELAQLMVSIGKLANKNVSAILTSMDEPLGNKIGNSLEVIEAIEALKGNGPEDLKEVVYEIASILIEDANISKKEDAYKLFDQKIKNGEAFNKLVEMVKAQGGNIEVIKNPELFEKARNIVPLKALNSGYIEEMDNHKIGLAAMVLGAGRATMDDVIDNAVGLDFVKKIGSYVNEGDTILYIHANDKGLEQSIKLLNEAIKIGKTKKDVTLIKGIIR